MTVVSLCKAVASCVRAARGRLVTRAAAMAATVACAEAKDDSAAL